MNEKGGEMTQRKYGWRRDLPDFRDEIRPWSVTDSDLPKKVDLRPNCPPVYDQGQTGSCTANAIAAALEFDQQRQKMEPLWVPSRLFIYWNERATDGDADVDHGSSIRTGMKVVSSLGYCEESEWPFDPANVLTKPPDEAFALAKNHQAVKYQCVVQSLTFIKQALASGFPVVFGFTVYSSFESDAVARTGIVPMPKPDESVLGGHAVAAVGYDDGQQAFIVRNSWGAEWGDQGYCYMPYLYVCSPDLAADLWTIETVR